MSDSIDDLVAFFGGQLDEDERIVLNAPRHDWTILLARDAVTGEQTEQRVLDHVMRHDPSRVLREIESGRRLIKRYENAVAVDTSIASFTRGQDDGYRQACLDAIRDKAEVYAEHPDYCEEWRPE